MIPGRNDEYRTAHDEDKSAGPLSGSTFRSRHAAFSMIELLIVVVITLLAAGIAMPAFMRSFQSSQLRSSARTLVMSAKYCRSMAVLKQKPMALLIDRASGVVEVWSIHDRSAVHDRDRFLDDRAARGASQPGEATGEGEQPAFVSELVRPLARDIKVLDFESSRKESESKGSFWFMFHPNGMCDGFSVQIEDKQGKRATVTVNAITSGAKVDYEQ